MAFENPTTGNEPGDGGTLSGTIPTYPDASLPSPAGKIQLARLTDENKGIVVANGTNWTPIEGLQVYKPEDFGAVGDGSTDCANAFDAIIAAMPATGGIIALGSAVNYFLSRSWHITKPTMLCGVGNGFGFAASRFKLAAGASIVVDTAASSPFPTQPGGGGSILKDFLLIGTTPPVWQATHGYTVGQVICNPAVYGGFTQLVYICTIAGTSGSSAPAFTVRDPVHSYVTEGVTFTDGTVTWKAISSPGIWVKNKCTVDNVYCQQAPGDGIFCYGYTGQTPQTGCSTFQIQNCSQQLNLGRGIYVEGSDANGGIVTANLAQNNWSGGYFDNSDIGNLWCAALTEANGVGVWGPGNPIANFNQLGTGAAVVPTPNAMDAMQTAAGNVYYYTGTGSGSSGGSEPSWPTTIGLTVTDGGITWTCAGIYAYGQANLTGRQGLNSAVFIGCYQEGDQRLNEMGSTNIWVGDIGGFFRSNTACWIQRASGASAYNYKSPAVSPHIIRASVGDPALVNDAAFTWETADASVVANDYNLSLSSDAKYWLFQSENSVGSLYLSNASAPEGLGRAVIKGNPGLYLNGITGGARAWRFAPFGLDATGGPPAGDYPDAQAGDYAFQVYEDPTTSYPDGWFCSAAGSPPTFQEFNFDKKRKIIQVTNGIGSPYTIVNVSGCTLRNQVYSNFSSGVLSCATLPSAAVAQTDYKFHFIAEPGGAGWRINAPGSTKISVGGVTSSAGGYVQCLTPGAWLTLESCGHSDPIWVASASIGEWTTDIAAAPLGVERLLSTAVIDCSISTKQSLFTVPGNRLVVTKVVLRTPTATLTTASLPFGYNANGDNIYTSSLFPGLTAANTVIVPITQNVPFGVAADVLGTKLTATQAATSVTADVFGYFF